jgi:hypothetical protein
MRNYLVRQEYQDMHTMLAGIPLLEPKVLGTIEARDAGEALQIAARRYKIAMPLIGVSLLGQGTQGQDQPQGGEAEG